jgi:hypothetical protein
MLRETLHLPACIYTALPVKQEYKDKNFYGEIVGCKRPKITKSPPTGLTDSHSNTYLSMFPFNGVNMCIMFHTYHSLQNFFTYHEKPPTRPRRHHSIRVHTNLLKKSYLQEKISNSYEWTILTPPCHWSQYFQHSKHKWFQISWPTTELSLEIEDYVQKFPTVKQSTEQSQTEIKWVQTPTDILPFLGI